MKIQKTAIRTVKGMKEAFFRPVLMTGKIKLMMKLASQLMRAPNAMAFGRDPCENSSAMIIHGIDPGPNPKKPQYMKVKMIAKVLITLVDS